ncbi:MAG: Fic family protein, partial [Clostridia bacterium]|nr:Fic family protein [Clostridia bacterium]
LNEVREKGNYEQWLKFFLRAVDESATEAIDTIEKLKYLHNRNITIVNSIRGREGITLRKVFGYIEHSPIINITKTSRELGLSFNSTAAAVARLNGMNILKPGGEQKRNRIFIYESYMDILKKGT